MIDKSARTKLSESLRHLVSGQITNYQFDNNMSLQSKDRAIRAIRLRAWHLYDDLRQYKLKGKYAIPPKDKSVVARWLLFLKTDLEYEWPTHPSETWWGMLLSLFSLTLIPKMFWNKKWTHSGNSKYWPFIREKDFKKIRRTPRLLSGAGRS